MNTTKPEHYSQNRSFQHSLGLEVLRQNMTWEEGDTVLDAGCGTGEICSYISQQPGVASVVGFDVSPDFISYASQYNSFPNLLYHVSDITDASTVQPEWHGAFSKAVCFAVLHWVQDKAAALKVLHSCLKPGGEALLWFGSSQSKLCRGTLGMTSHPKWKTYLKDFVPKFFPWPSSDLANEDHSSRLMEECGFEVFSCRRKEYEHMFGSKDQRRETLRAIFPQLRYIPEEKHEEFLDDVENLGRDLRFVLGDYSIAEDCHVVHARKL